MKDNSIAACYVNPAPSKEQFIPEHCFMYLIEGAMHVYDGVNEYKIKAGDYGVGRRNHLSRYVKQAVDGKFKKIYVLFDQDFLKAFQNKYGFRAEKNTILTAIVPIAKSELVKNFIHSLLPYFTDNGTIEATFLEVKRTELLLVLLKAQPDLANVLFDFGNPEKIDLEKFMNANFKFNVSVEKFAYLTGRSLSAFKRDFEKIFHTTPKHWLVQKRLEEAHFLIERQHKKPSEIYIELGFEDFSHFSFAFRKRFGHSPAKLQDLKTNESGNTVEPEPNAL